MVTTPVMIVTPIWRPALDEIEARLMRVTDRTNASTPRAFVAPRGMDVSWYAQHFPDWEVRFVGAEHLESVTAYSAWMTSPDPYRLFSDVSTMIVCQTDALLVRSVLDLQAESFDFLGAPWSPPVRVFRIGHRMSVFSPTGGGPLHARLFGQRLWVGNGGLSIRKTAAFEAVAVRLATRFPAHLRTRIHEDVYFAALGPTAGLVIADRWIAGSVFCESAAQGLDMSGQFLGFHGLQRWNPSLARQIMESRGASGAS